jgi:predicted RNA-binding protein
MIITLDVKDSVADKIMYLLNNLKDDVRVIKKQEGTLVASVMESEKDLKYGRVTKIEDIDKHIEELDNATK